MNQNQFPSETKDLFQRVADEGLSLLQGSEAGVFNLDAEDSFFLRLNNNKVRQNTHLQQLVLSLRFQKDGRTVEVSRTLSGRLETDLQFVKQMISTARQEAIQIPIDPHQVAIQNHGTSSADYKGQLQNPTELIETITSTSQGHDLAGLYCGGPVISANRNSAGQNHWFSTHQFFMDYSIYNGEKASKSVYAGNHWNNDQWTTSLQRASQQLDLLNRPTQKVQPGQYRTYLAPGAVAEILSTLSWGGLSASAWKLGQSPLRRLADRELKLSPLFSLRENFDLGLTPAFNSLGEVSAQQVPLIENGELKQLLVSSRSEKEFGLKSNAAKESEGLRSPEILPGTLAEAEILSKLETGLYLSNLHYLNWSDPNSARITGMTRYACFWVEKGEIVGPIKDLRFDESLYEALGSKLLDLTEFTEIDPSVQTYGARSLGGKKTPGLLIQDWTFTL